ncbi:hypothetical protein BU25DRAFT_311293, partial [Macroventuria anomochaeta]
AFEKSLRIKSMIDELEIETQNKPSAKILAAIVSSEYRLWVLNAETPLRHNPFLSHWVEAVQRLEAATQSHTGQPATGNVSAEDIAATRLEMIKRLLGSEEPGGLATATPLQLYNARYSGTPFDVQPYIRMLEEEGIYDPSSTPSTSNAASNAALPEVAHRDVATAVESTQNPTLQEWKATPRRTFEEFKVDLQLHLNVYPDHVVDALTHLPIAIPALDLLTTLITNGTLAKHNIDSKPVVLAYVQHALRLVEYMGQPPDPNTRAPRQTECGIETDDDHGREAQSRAIRLLILFMRNLIKKGLADVGPSGESTLYFDIQGICVRYVWMKEVRAFRTWIDEGE